MADIKVNVGDKVVVYRNMPKLDFYPEEVSKGFKGVVKMVRGDTQLPCGKWAEVWDTPESCRYIKLTYLKHA